MHRVVRLGGSAMEGSGERGEKNGLGRVKFKVHKRSRKT